MIFMPSYEEKDTKQTLDFMHKKLDSMFEEMFSCIKTKENTIKTLEEEKEKLSKLLLYKNNNLLNKKVIIETENRQAICTITGIFTYYESLTNTGNIKEVFYMQDIETKECYKILNRDKIIKVLEDNVYGDK